MRKYLFLSLFFCIIYPQIGGLALFGVGEDNQNTDPATLGLGNGKFFSGNSKNISSNSISSIWRSTFTQFTISTGMNSLITPSLARQFQHNLTHFSLLFPIGNKRVFGFGLQPVYRTNKVEILESFQFIGADESITGNPLIYRSNYSIDGGMSELFIQYSQKLSSKISIGLQYSILFGNQFLNDELYTYDIEIDTVSTAELIVQEILVGEEIFYIQAANETAISIQEIHKFSGNAFTLEGRYTLPRHEWVLKAGINENIQIDKEVLKTISDTLYIDKFNYMEPLSISSIGLGYHYLLLDDLGFIMELHKKYPLSIPKHIALFNILSPEQRSVHFGSYLKINNSKIGYWNNINLRVGVYLKELDFIENKFIDYGATIGLGIEYLKNTKAIDFGIRFGKKESQIIVGEIEDYVSLQIGITTQEKWFMKKRRK